MIRVSLAFAPVFNPTGAVIAVGAPPRSPTCRLQSMSAAAPQRTSSVRPKKLRLLPRSVRQPAMVRGIAAMTPRAAPVSGRAAIAVIGVAEFPGAVGEAAIIRRVAAMAPRTAPGAGAAAAGGFRGLGGDER